jgi:hypothetical protein
MAIEKLENIKFQGDSDGELFGAKIVGFNLDVGTSRKSTSLSVTIMNETGIYPDLAPELSYLAPKKIYIGANVLYMYLVEFQKTSSPDNKQMALEFVDGSHILDRVFVGLINEHTDSIAHVSERDLEFTVPVCCVDCSGNPHTPLTIGDTLKFTNQTREQSFTTYNPIGDGERGGMVFVGYGGWINSNCDIATYTYTIGNLIHAVMQLGVQIDFPNWNAYTAFTRSHSGTLRSVLNNWCSELNYTYVWDYSTNPGKLSFINLGDSSTLPSTIDTIVDAVNNLDDLGESIVQSIDTGASLKDTFKNYQVTQYKNSNRKPNFSKTTNYLSFLRAVTVPDIQSTIALGRPYGDLYVSAALGKYDDISRSLWNFSKGYLPALGFRGESFQLTTSPLQVPRVVGNGQQTISNPWQEVMMANPNVSSLLVDYHKSVYNLHGVPAAAGINWRHIPPSWYKLYIGVHDKTTTSEEKSKDTAWADDFFGRYFYNSLSPESFRKCVGNSTQEVRATFTPETENILSPFEDYLASNPFDINEHAPWFNLMKQGGNDSNGNFIAQDPPTRLWPTGFVPISYPIRLLNRTEHEWGQKLEETRGQYKDNCGTPWLKDFAPQVLSLDKAAGGAGGIANYLRGIFQYIHGTQATYLNKCQEVKNKISFLLGPSDILLSRITSISSLYKTLNSYEKTYLQDVNDSQESCVTTCEEQNNLISDEICDCEEGSFPPSSEQPEDFSTAMYLPQPEKFPHAKGLTHRMSWAFTQQFEWESNMSRGYSIDNNEGFPPDTIQIVFPCGMMDLYQAPNEISYYRLNFSESVTKETVLQKQEVAINNFDVPGNVSKIVVNENDVSKEVDQFDSNCADSSQILNTYLPGIGFTSIEDYHNLYTSLLNTGSELPRKAISVSIIGLSLGALSQYVHPSLGLESYSVGMSNTGFSSRLSWASKPRTFPSVQFSMQTIKPTARNYLDA